MPFHIDEGMELGDGHREVTDPIRVGHLVGVLPFGECYRNRWGEEISKR
jgi:hypothetical protein